MKNAIIHLDTITQSTIINHLPNKKVCNKLADFYSMFSDETRLKIITALLLKEMCVNDLSKLLSINQTTISHQLKILKSNGAVYTTRNNKYIFYKVNNSIINNIMINGVDYILNKNPN
jgi:ArsR family transcriptional regulator